MPLTLSIAFGDYDRTRPLRDGSVVPEGIDLNCITLPVQETFFRMLKYHEFDAAEMSFGSYIRSLDEEKPKLVAIPVFLSRLFRHASIYVNDQNGIGKPKDLIGKRVGNPEYQLTACVWVRGILSDMYGVPVSSVTYYTGGEEQPGTRKEKIPLNLPSEIKVVPIGPTQTLSSMLNDGLIDALYTPRVPSCFLQGKGRVRRLFPNFLEADRKYYAETKIFPIMHTVVIRRDVYEANRWVAKSLYKAFLSAREVALNDLLNAGKEGTTKLMLPFIASYVEDTVSLLGRDFWPYGVSENHKAIDTLLRYAVEQGLAKKRRKPEEIFAPETLESHII